MKKIQFLFAVSLISFLFSTAFAQQKRLSPSEIFLKAQEHYEKEEYQKAIELYNSIDEADSLYSTVLVEKALVLYKLEDFDGAISNANAVIKENPKFDPSVYSTLGKAWENKGDTAKAIAVYTEGINLYPYYYPFYFDIGLIERERKNFIEAIDYFQKTLLINPFHASAHIFLGIISAQQGNYTHAFLSLSAALLIHPRGSFSESVLVHLEKICNNSINPEESIPASLTANEFSEIDLLMKSKVALNANFKTPVKLNAAVVKQSKMFLEKFNYNKSSDNFWMKFYGPFFQRIKNENLFEPFIYLMVVSADIPEVDKWLKKNVKKKEQLILAGNQEFTNHRNIKTIIVNEKPEKLTAWYYDNNLPLAYGKIVNEDADKKTGFWMFFHENGNQRSEGSYDSNFKHTGEWKSYTDRGILVSVENYKNGEKQGLSTIYLKDGNVASKANYKEGQLDGKVELFHSCGTVRKYSHYSKGELNGDEKVYNSAGILIDETNYKAGKAVGPSTEYYDDGTKKTELTFKEGKIDGKYRQYDMLGNLTLDAIAKDGKASVNWKYLYDNGKLSFDVTFNAEGNRHGLAKSYSRNGTLIKEIKYNNGNIEEETEYDDWDGKLWIITKTSNNKIQSLKYFDKQGKEISSYSYKKSKLPVKGFFPEGTVMFTGFLSDGVRDGEWTYFYTGGAKKTVKFFDKGTETGKYTEYHRNGKIRKTSTYVDGKFEGDYKEYFPSGTIQTEGRVIGNEETGLWKYYYKNGKLESESYYNTGQVNSWNRSFSSSGELFNKRKTDFGKLEELVYYEKNGDVKEHIVFTNGNGTLKLSFATGKTKGILPVKCSDYNGNLSWYFVNGQKSSEAEMIAGRKNGDFTSYFENGTVRSKGKYIRDNQVGHWIYFDENGQKLSEGNYRNGRDSIWTYYWPNGKVRRIIEYREGDLHGTNTLFDTEGNLVVELTFKDDYIYSYRFLTAPGQFSEPEFVKDGKLHVKASYASGVKSADLLYEGSVQHGKQVYYFSNGNLMLQYEMDHGNQFGPEKNYYYNGKLRSEMVYSDGEIDGERKSYAEDGTLTKVETFISGDLNGPVTQYDKSGKVTSVVTYWNDSQYE